MALHGHKKGKKKALDYINWANPSLLTSQLHEAARPHGASTTRMERFPGAFVMPRIRFFLAFFFLYNLAPLSIIYQTMGGFASDTS